MTHMMIVCKQHAYSIQYAAYNIQYTELYMYVTICENCMYVYELYCLSVLYVL